MAQVKRFSRKQIAEQSSKEQTMFIMQNQVYNVTKFLDEHPGGREVLLGVSGKDASSDFDDIGHSSDAVDMLTKYRIGEVIDEEKIAYKNHKGIWEGKDDTNESSEGLLNSWKVPIVLGLLMAALYSYIFG